MQNHILFKKCTALCRQFTQFERQITEIAGLMRVNLADYRLDHVALRANSKAKAAEWKDLLEKCGQILNCSEVNGRPIYLFELDSPLLLLNKAVSVVELPYPKGKIYAQESWEHIEIVMPFLDKECTNEWLQRIERQFLWNHLPELSVKVSEPKVEGEVLSNPSIAVSLANKQQNPCCIKIHPYDIKQIIEVQKL